jgi:hypothetical protein
MFRPIVISASLLTVIGAQISVPPSGTGTLTPVRDVTKAPSATEIEFVGFDFQRPQPAHGGVFLFEISGEPGAGLRYPVEATIGGEAAVASASFDVIAEDGTIIQSLPIARGDRSGQTQFIGMMTVPSQPFRILLTGQSVDGRRFEFLYRRLFRPGKGSLEIPADAPVPPEFGGQRRLMDAEAKRLIVEAERYAATNAVVPLVMPRAIVSKVMYEPLRSVAGRPIGVRVIYDVEFSQGGEYDPRVNVYADSSDDVPSGILGTMRVVNSSLEPVPRLAHAPSELAGTNHRDSVLAYGADFLYDARTVYHFSVDLVPGFISPGSGGSPACIWREGLRTTPDPERAFANLLSREGPSTYRVSIGDRLFEGRIENFAGEGTLYRNLVAEGTQDCSQIGR